jgi:bile acid:Na+ symporter, BASS family
MKITIQVLTCSALAGLLGAVGLRLTWREITTARKQCRLAVILVVNFVAIPLLALAIASGFSLRRELVIALILLAASPFAPVVPVFARMARADLALAAALTGVLPLAAAPVRSALI